MGNKKKEHAPVHPRDERGERMQTRGMFLEICVDEESAFCPWSRRGHGAPVRCYRHGPEGFIQAGIRFQGFSDSWAPGDARHRRSRYLNYLMSCPYGGDEVKVPERRTPFPTNNNTGCPDRQRVHARNPFRFSWAVWRPRRSRNRRQYLRCKTRRFPSYPCG